MRFINREFANLQIRRGRILVAPLADAVRFINGEKLDGCLEDRAQESTVLQTFRSDVDKVVLGLRATGEFDRSFTCRLHCRG